MTEKEESKGEESKEIKNERSEKDEDNNAEKNEESWEDETKGRGKERIRVIDIKLRTGVFTALLRRFTEAGRTYGGLNFSGISAVRQLLSNEKARLLYTLQTKKPSSLYELAKALGRDFKSVRKDIELLRHFGFVRFVSEAKGKRRRLRPVINLDKLQLTISLK